jgi:hypothetical protein
VRLEGLGKVGGKKNNDLIGNRTRHLPACSIVKREIFNSHILSPLFVYMICRSMATPREDGLVWPKPVGV